jgi:hypothetical protein
MKLPLQLPLAGIRKWMNFKLIIIGKTFAVRYVKDIFNKNYAVTIGFIFIPII